MTSIATHTASPVRHFAADAAVGRLLNRLTHLAAIAAPRRSEPQRPHSLDLDRLRTEQVRWIILRALDAAAPIGASQDVLLHLLRAMYPDMDMPELCHELEHLALRGLAVIHRYSVDQWIAETTEQGALVVGYCIPCPAGIGRPSQGQS